MWLDVQLSELLDKVLQDSLLPAAAWCIMDLSPQ